MRDLDKSNGYEDIASLFISRRALQGVGTSVVADWSRTLPPGATMLDIGCGSGSGSGSGAPISEVLINNGFAVYAVDASPSMVKSFRALFPSVPVECAAVEESNFFGRNFDGVVAWGLFFSLRSKRNGG